MMKTRPNIKHPIYDLVWHNGDFKFKKGRLINVTRCRDAGSDLLVARAANLHLATEDQIFQPLERAQSYLSSDIKFLSVRCQNPQMQKTNIDSDMHFNNTLNFNAVYSKGL
jgi:hypothetical protein